MSTLVLIYHGMTEVGGGTGNLHIMPRKNFVAQLEHLKSNRYPMASWRQLGEPATTGPRPRVAITFDDGYQSDLENARLLHAMGYDALFFVPTEYIGRPGYLSREDIVAIRKMGMGIGSHAHHHSVMAPLSETSIQTEFQTSKRILENILQEPVLHFSFPGGSYNQRMLQLGRQLSYRYFFTSDWGVNGPKQSAASVFRRTSVLNHTKTSQFDAMLQLRNYFARQVMFQTKEFAKRIAGEERYVKLRQSLLDTVRSRGPD